MSGGSNVITGVLKSGREGRETNRYENRSKPEYYNVRNDVPDLDCRGRGHQPRNVGGWHLGSEQSKKIYFILDPSEKNTTTLLTPRF